ncbi:MAG: alanine racemase [Sulfurimonas sp.]|nr:MAG: alanine racemase [Sulfurimonas sp.]
MAHIILKRSSFFHNLDIIAATCGSKEKIALVLKDNAYGHGLIEMATLAAQYGITRAVVRHVHEAKRVAEYFEYILILADTTYAPNPKFHYTLNALEDIDKLPAQCNVELKVDTGMHRNGIDARELEEAFTRIAQRKLRLKGLFSHHRSADTLSSEWFWQRHCFEKIKAQAKTLHQRHSHEPLACHISNSAALFREGACNDAMVRVGIAAYGVLELDATLTMPPLQPVLSLYAEKISSRVLRPHERIGYNGTYTATENHDAATYNIGYADGFMRCYAPQFRTPEGIAVLGRISMDNSSFDTTKETLLLFDDARVAARAGGTITYEVLSALKADLQRHIV